MKLYIAAGEQDYAREVRDVLVADGHEVTSRWIDSETFGKGPPYDRRERRANAIADEEDVRKAIHGVVLLTSRNGQRSKGGRHVETGIALGLRRHVFVVGQEENVFHWHPDVFVMPAVEHLRVVLAQSQKMIDSGKCKTMREWYCEQHGIR